MAADDFNIELNKNSKQKKQNLLNSLTDSEIKEKLHGYIEVPPDCWDGIKHDQHIRYFVKKIGQNPGGYRPGGFVEANPSTITKDGKVIKVIKLKNSFTKGEGKAWTVAYDSLDKVFMKVDAQMKISSKENIQIIQALNEHIEYTKRHLKKQSDKIKELSEEIRTLKNMRS